MLASHGNLATIISWHDRNALNIRVRFTIIVEIWEHHKAGALQATNWILQ
jgi:hypothetical protein